MIVVAPTYLAGEGIAHKTRGTAGLHRTTLVQFAAELAKPEMAVLGLAPLTALGVEAIAARVIHAERDTRPFAYFEAVAEMPGFARALARTLGELRLARVTPESLKKTGAPGSDLARLLTRYASELAERSLADLARIFDLAGNAKSHRWLGLPLLFLDTPLDSLAHREFFRCIAAQAPSVFAAASTDLEALEEILGVAAQDLDESEPESSLEHLRRYLFAVSPPPYADTDRAFEVFSAPGEALEAVEIARRILAFAAEGLPFDRMAILLRSPDRYQPVMEDALRRANIPAYFSRGTARPDPGGRAFLALLACAAEKCPASRFAEYLSLGQVPEDAGRFPEWVGAEDELLSPAPAPEFEDRTEKPAPSAWEKLLVDAAVIGGRDRWARRLQGLEREFELRLSALEREDDEASRRHLARQLEQLRQFEQFALPLIETLDALPAEALWKDWLESLDALARRALRNPEGVLSVLAEFEPMGEVGPATLDEVAEVLGERLGFLRRDPPDRRYGHVLVCSIEESRGQEFAVVFLPGLAEGLFPQKALEDPLLLDAFRKAADQNLPLRHHRVDQERVRLHLAVAAANEKLVVSYPRMDVAEARPRVPSFYALELPRAIQGSLPELKKFEEQTRDAAPARLNWPAPNDAAQAIDDAEYDLVALHARGSAQYLVEANDRLARSLRARWYRWESKGWRESDGLISTDARALAALSEHRLAVRPWSPSALQRFAVCPYQFALHGIYGLRPRENPEPLEQMDPLTRGALFHAVQFRLLGELKMAELLPVNSERLAQSLAIADRVLNQVAQEFADELAPAIDRVWRTEIEDLRTDLRGWLQHIAVNDDDWIPEHFEFAFGLKSQAGRDAASTNEQAILEEGVHLRGSIDLVERHATRGVLRVTDHKTGKAPESPPAYVGGGLFLQPLLYGLAARQLLSSDVECGRLFYATQRGEYKYTPIQITERSRAILAKLLANIDGSIAQGFLPPSPQKEACGYCDYRPVCGPYEEFRSSKKNRHDERLEALIEIRGMA
ncbi:MAG TPA: PD-(D/E)XK nuclease family protein [Bryobacteraceae bacterium]|jgi:ATP-dependent helicase/nuclease subunit B|nr:PD-(D/E)XK nuclease family protein [Bryobacteraceae bacterium]